MKMGKWKILKYENEVFLFFGIMIFLVRMTKENLQ